MQREELFSALGTLMIRFKVYAKRALQQVRQAVPLALDLKTACLAPGAAFCSAALCRKPLTQLPSGRHDRPGLQFLWGRGHGPG